MSRSSNPGYPIERLVNEVGEHLDGSSTALLRRFADASAARGRRVAAARTRLEATLGGDHPRVQRLARRAELAEAVAARLADTGRRVDADKPLRPHEWLAHGRVVREDDTPLSGMHVRVFDRDDGHDDLLGDEVTDDSGEFRAVYHRRDFDDEDSRQPDLAITVTDAAGVVVFVSTGAVPASPDRSDFFQIVLSAERLANGAPRTGCEATTAKGATCKNLAEPGATLCSVHATGR